MEWKMEKTLFKQGGPFSTKAGIHRGPVSRYILYKKLQKYNMTSWQTAGLAFQRS